MTNPRDNRNSDNRQGQSFDLITFKLDQLMGTTENGFKELKDYYAQLEKRVNVLEIWKAGEEAADKIRAAEAQRLADAEDRKNNQPATTSKDNTDNLIKIIFIVLGLLGTALGLVGSGIIK